MLVSRGMREDVKRIPPALPALSVAGSLRDDEAEKVCVPGSISQRKNKGSFSRVRFLGFRDPGAALGKYV